MLSKTPRRNMIACGFLTMLLAFSPVLPAGLASVFASPRQAYAQDTRTWTYVGGKTFKENYDPFYPGYGSWCVPHTTVNYGSNSYSATSIGMRENGEAVIAEYEESYEWGNPPTTIFVGDEADASMNVTISWSYTAREEYESWSPGTGYPSFSAQMTLYEYIPNGADTGPFSRNAVPKKNVEIVSADGRTEFPEAEKLGSMKLAPGEWVTLESMVGGSLSNPVTDGLDTWDEGDPITEISRSTSESVSGQGASSGSWSYGRDLAKGNYKIRSGEHYANYDGPGDYEASAYLLVITVYAGHSTYIHDYYYTFFPNEVEATPVVASTATSEQPTEKPQNVVIETEAPKEVGESRGDGDGWMIPAAIVGVAVAGGAAALALRRRKKSDGDDSSPGEPEKPSTYRMVLWKDFGDTIVAGAGPQKIGARIEEVKPDGAVVERPDLTAKITFSVSENIRAQALGMEDPYQCINVEPVEPVASDAGIVAIKFTGEGGTFTNNVHFKIAELQLVFPDIPLTFVAGKQQTWQMAFKFSLEEIATKCEPRFEVNFTTHDAEKCFKGQRVVRDKEFPEKLFDVELTECGPVKEDDIAGTMQTYTCEVIATLPPGAVGPDEREVRGSFSFFRFTEGLRFTVEPLKCYYIKHVEKEEDLVNADEALDMAMQAQTQAMGLAGGSIAAAVGTASALREVERDLKERFPEVFREDDVYVFDKRDKIMLTPGRTHAYATLFVVDEFQDEHGKPYLRPITPLPKKDDMQLAFEDVPGSSVLRDKEGREIANPVETLDFRYFISKVQHTDNTVVFEILPTKGVMLPPNRSQVDIAAVVKWEDHSGQTRTFTAKERVNAISQPYRPDFDEKADEYIKADDEVRKMLYGIQHKIQRTSGKLAAKGSISIGQTASDVFASQLDAVEEHPILALNPITAPGVALYQLYISARELGTSISNQTKDVYYDNLMPIYHYIEMMLEGHEYEFGFYDYDVKRIVTTFARFETGQLGAAEAIDLAYHGHDMMFADALSMTVQDWNHSWTAIGVRVGFALVTGGQSEWLFMPMAAIGAGMEASMDYIDKGGDKLLEAYRVGMSASAKHALVEAAFMGVMHVAAKCVKFAWVITKEGFSQRQLFVKALKEMFSTAKYGQKVATVAKGLEGQLARASAKADAVIRAYRGGAQAGAQNIEREIAYTLGRLEGGYKLDALKDLVAGGGSKLNAFQQRAIIVTIQSDKHAMRALMEATGAEADAMRSFFSRAIGQIEKDALLKARTVLSERLKIPMDKLRVKGTSGNTGKVSMDLDATFQYFDDAAGQWKDVKAALGQEAFDAEFYKIVKGYAAESDDIAAAFARNADMTITDMFHPEAYSPEYADALRVIDATRAGEAFAYGSKVANVAKYKCDHWLQLARRAAADADAASAAGKLLDAQRLAAASEAFAEESARQFTKQADRLIINKIAAMQAKGIKASTSVNVDAFLEKVAVLKRSGMGRFGGTGLTSGEVDAVLKNGYQTGLDALYGELETLTVELDNAIKAAAK